MDQMMKIVGPDQNQCNERFNREQNQQTRCQPFCAASVLERQGKPATGTMTIPRDSMLSQKSLAGMSPPANSKAYPSDHSATASIRIVNGAIPAVKRRLQAKSASPADITAAMTTGNRYGVNRQYIVLLLSCLIVQPFGRAPWYSALLVGPGPVTQFVCSAKQLLKKNAFGDFGYLAGIPGLINFNA